MFFEFVMNSILSGTNCFVCPHVLKFMVYPNGWRQGLNVAVAGIPKTIDNDLDVIDRSFGFLTAVEVRLLYRWMVAPLHTLKYFTAIS